MRKKSFPLWIFLLFQTNGPRSHQICNQKTDRSVMIDALWKDDWEKNGFQESFSQAL